MKKATLKDVAEKAGVSKATVSYIVNNVDKPISDETRTRVLKAMEELHYVPNIGAASLTNKSSRLIGVVIPQTEPGSGLMFQNGFYSELLSAIELQARKKGYRILISGTDLNESYLRLVMERSLDGVIAIGVYPDAFYEQLKELDVPLVMVDSYSSNRLYPNIHIDDEMGGYMATSYLLKKGHRKIGFLSGFRHEDGVVQKRFNGYRRALEEWNIELDEKIIYEGCVNYETGVLTAERIVREKAEITALATTADPLAIGAIKGFMQNGVTVPEDYSVIGFDNQEIAGYIHPALTTIGQDIGKKGRMAMDLLATWMENGSTECEDIVLPFSMIERESVKELK